MGRQDCARDCRVVYIIEDNASPHTKAKRFSGKARQMYNGRVQVVDWPPLSPDLNRIERCWGHLKDRFQTLRAESHDGQPSRATIVDETTLSWRQLPQRIIMLSARDSRRSFSNA
ncbi:hypothetical protein K469DRAFT_159200 [Zopfia rhizophila CBS 207.26]|uniref:Tc1-like transposase DDE domain-containing protein n=1 Tax=Zopfia rhizophila CBS 207.26 TaxID=1314779 RepID=A0A6A6D526_9PEZI|nr:hypothetical protein K469DRAFT_159200 [Zopfia rhizophila CBS 207.26]